jgi:hypothetical protein
VYASCILVHDKMLRRFNQRYRNIVTGATVGSGENDKHQWLPTLPHPSRRK